MRLKIEPAMPQPVGYARLMDLTAAVLPEQNAHWLDTNRVISATMPGLDLHLNSARGSHEVDANGTSGLRPGAVAGARRHRCAGTVEQSSTFRAALDERPIIQIGSHAMSSLP